MTIGSFARSIWLPRLAIVIACEMFVTSSSPLIGVISDLLSKNGSHQFRTDAPTKEKFTGNYPTMARQEAVPWKPSQTTESHQRENSTILSPIGKLQAPISIEQFNRWKSDLESPNLNFEERSWRRLWIAEAELAKFESPETATTMFDRLARDLPQNSVVRSHALLGKGFALIGAGRYRSASNELTNLVRNTPRGLNRKQLQYLTKHAKSCANYHDERERAGITEPDRLDPLCGASSLATIFRKLGIQHDRERMAKLVRHTGFGSNMQDLIDAASSKGLTGRVVTTSDVGLRVLLTESKLPVVARVEHDHFISVLRANDAGVTYSCSDCGIWPGGEQTVNWNQWKMLEPDAYLAVGKLGSPFARALNALEGPKDTFSSFGESIETSLSSSVGESARIGKELESAQVVIFWFPLRIICGLPASTTNCLDGNCPPVQFCPVPQTALATATEDPVNLATGAEIYKPTPMMHVYNPIGPSVTWSHAYNSMSNTVPNGFGAGWYHPYLFTIYLAVGSAAPGPIGDPPGPPTTGGGSGSENGLSSGGGNGDVADSSGYIIFPNSATAGISFSTASAPSSSATSFEGTIDAGLPYKVEWKYDSGAPGQAVVVLTDKSRSQYTFKQLGTLPSPNTLRYYYLAKITDRNGRYITLNWDAEYTFNSHNIFTNSAVGLALTSISDDQSSTLLTLGYGSTAGRIVSATDRYGRSIYYTVDDFPNEHVPSGYHQVLDELIQVSTLWTGGGSPTLQYQYTYENQTNWEGYETVPYLKTISVPSPSGSGSSIATIYYNSYGFVWKTVDANGNRTLYTPQTGNETKVTTQDSSGNTVREIIIGYDAKMNSKSLKNAAGNTIYSATFGDASTPYRPSAITDGNSRTWSMNWDQYNNLISTTTPKSVTTTNTWSYSNFALGEMTATQTGSKTTTTLTYYEPSGLVETVNTPIPGESSTGNRQTTTYTYDSLGNVLTVVTPGNNAASTKTTTYNYTSDGTYSQSAKIGQPIKITDPLGKVYHFRYDSRGNPTSSWDPLGYTYTTDYNLADQVTYDYSPNTGQTGSNPSFTWSSYLYAGGPSTQSKAYDESATLVRTVDVAFGAEGELLSRTGSTESVYLTYDATYRIKTLKDGNDKQTTYAYNTNGQVSSISFPLATGTYADKVQFTSYDNVGNLLTRIDGSGITTSYQYTDTDGLLSAISYTGFSSQNVAIDYDDYDRATEITDGSGTSTAEFDDLNNLTTSTRTYTGIAGKTFDYSYYPDGSRQELSTPAGDWTYGYNANGWCTSSTSPAGSTTYQFADNGWITKRTLPNSSYTDYDYFEVGALKSLANKTSAGTTLSSFGTFVYDGVFNLKNVTSSVPAQTSYQGTQTWTYDTKDRLTAESGSRLSGYSHSFGYDSAGNPTTFKGSTVSFNDDNQRTGTGFAYDGNGNATTYASSTLTFDVENRMTAYGAHSYGYRSDGLRAWKEPEESTKTYFLYDGGNPIIELDSEGSVARINDFAPDGLVGRKVGSTWSYYVFDQQGNVAERLSSTQTVNSHAVYDAYGVETATGGTTDPFGYNGQWGYYRDAETGNYLCQHRYYDASRGRWLTRDPIGYSGGINLYGYCGSGPVEWTDPSGLDRITWLYGLIDKATGELLKWGVSFTPFTRHATKFLNEHNAKVVLFEGSESRGAMFGQEYFNTSHAPGRLNNESWAGKGKDMPDYYKIAPCAVPVVTGEGGWLKDLVEFFDPTPIGAGMGLANIGISFVDPYATEQKRKRVGSLEWWESDATEGGNTRWGL